MSSTKLDDLDLEGQVLKDTPQIPTHPLGASEPHKLARHLTRHSLERERELWNKILIEDMPDKLGIKVQSKDAGVNLRTRLYHARTFIVYSIKDTYPEMAAELQRWSISVKCHEPAEQWYTVLLRGPKDMTLEDLGDLDI